MNLVLLYVAAAAWILGYCVIVYLYFAPCRNGCERRIISADENGRLTRGLPPRSARNAFFELAAAFFFVPVVLLVVLGGVVRDRWGRRRDSDAT